MIDIFSPLKLEKSSPEKFFFFDYSMLNFRSLGTNGFHVKAKNEIYTAAGSRCSQNPKYESLADYVRKLHQKACRTYRTIIFRYSSNEIIDCALVVAVAVVSNP